MYQNLMSLQRTVAGAKSSFNSFLHDWLVQYTVIIIIMGLKSVSASEDVIGDLNKPSNKHKLIRFTVTLK